ncbi:YqiA/YcfP family alpha/beta fold hydrolase [Microbulbifer thermotolerans]|uniref:Alpha/beta fold hydrolase n=2 Tax=Microbulbifer thermotolerans TaxID=252514 RepID=A0AB35HY55_MICTH|nr:YqiA/YcfP family alpha/beta fold hydrolase [Microbulbifer thermotolerans]MCX2781091.1 alpha/beta fold hydrolase [Microbulbifer thermotolerans]MCX2795328.1 alpha/beta fold hydrolase [Microbulbifer thermotolerans]MCX2801110.1 alpha/beta fold hydrolase [Microbulbifer thermotolerans]MCX2835185.1 alpha/beta fold hydrolase [Microbulbifer thermotolerans]MCX2841301.1 alpha/beta fold hydrolase [Microbulbifer thermotolerans]
MSYSEQAKRPLLIYLHGFLSSPQSFKCRLMRDCLIADYPRIIFCAPQISPYPETARQALVSLLENFRSDDSCGPIGLVGSSMGGFWATYLAEHYRLPAALVNPAVNPARRMPEYVGQTLRPYGGGTEEYRLTPADVDTMHRLEAGLQHPLRGRYWLLAQRGDETLDYREAVDFYRGQRQTVEDGGDHGFQGFARYCKPIVEFLFNP